MSTLQFHLSQPGADDDDYEDEDVRWVISPSDEAWGKFLKAYGFKDVVRAVQVVQSRDVDEVDLVLANDGRPDFGLKNLGKEWMCAWWARIPLVGMTPQFLEASRSAPQGLMSIDYDRAPCPAGFPKHVLSSDLDGTFQPVAWYAKGKKCCVAVDRLGTARFRIAIVKEEEGLPRKPKLGDRALDLACGELERAVEELTKLVDDDDPDAVASALAGVRERGDADAEKKILAAMHRLSGMVRCLSTAAVAGGEAHKMSGFLDACAHWVVE